MSIDRDGEIMLKAVSPDGDPVELTEVQAQAVAEALLRLVDEVRRAE
jgi:hypothetical protein